MGRVSHAGPVYGAKSLLTTFFSVVTSSGASTALAYTNSVRVVPPYEDWFITEMAVRCSTCTSNAAALYLKTEGGSTVGVAPRAKAPGNGSTRAATVLSGNSGTSTAWSTQIIATPDPGEFEGFWVPAGSSLRLVSSGNSGIGNLEAQVMGYIRYIDSTRSV